MYRDSCRPPNKFHIIKQHRTETSCTPILHTLGHKSGGLASLCVGLFTPLPQEIMGGHVLRDMHEHTRGRRAYYSVMLLCGLSPRCIGNVTSNTQKGKVSLWRVKQRKDLTLIHVGWLINSTKAAQNRSPPPLTPTLHALATPVGRDSSGAVNILWYFSLPFYQCYRYLNQYWLSVICRTRLALRGSPQLRLISVKRLAYYSAKRAQ